MKIAGDRRALDAARVRIREAFVTTTTTGVEGIELRSVRRLVFAE